MARHRYVVSIDTDTGETVAAEISADQANRLIIAPGDPRAIENHGRENVYAAVCDALASILPEPPA